MAIDLFKMSRNFTIDENLKDGLPVLLMLADGQDVEPMRQLLRMIVEEGVFYPHDRFDRSLDLRTILECDSGQNGG